MLKSAIVCTAILVGTMQARAQYLTPYPGPGALQSQGLGCGQNYDCMDRSRDLRGSMSPYYDNTTGQDRSYDPYNGMPHSLTGRTPYDPPRSNYDDED